MKQPYKVIVWGPGAVGKAGLRELLRRPEFEIVGVMGYSPDKIGKDVGELIGHAPIGVKVTNDKEAIFALDADCVFYTGAFPADAESMERDLIRILESGKHVVTSTSHHYPQFHSQAYMNRLEAACQKGGTCIHGSGENPGFWFERVALTLTGLCSEVEHLKLEEFVDCHGGTSAGTLYSVGFNQTVEQASVPRQKVAKVWEEYHFGETLALASQALFNRPPERIERKSAFHTTDKEIVLSKAKGDLMDMRIEKDRVSAQTHTFTAYLDGRPRLTDEVTWYLKPENAPFPIKDQHYWRIQLEGKPVSLSCEFSAFATLEGHQLKRLDDPTSVTWYITVLPMIQAIPIVCSHKPGVVLPSVFSHAVPDYRLLEGRTDVVG
ncbi:MAG: hypothetical protein PHQ05_14445 [Sterolibacterium sp.]|nr:hypothetical protein [Sterolibacterium sp.]